MTEPTIGESCPLNAPERWHLRREINISHLIATAALTVGLISWGMRMDGRVTRVETIVDHVGAEQASYRADLSARLGRIDGKLDRIVEAMIARGDRGGPRVLAAPPLDP